MSEAVDRADSPRWDLAPSPKGFPADTLSRFREASIGIQAIIWTTIGLEFGALASRVLAGKSIIPRREREAPKRHGADTGVPERPQALTRSTRKRSQSCGARRDDRRAECDQRGGEMIAALDREGAAAPQR